MKLKRKELLECLSAVDVGLSKSGDMEQSSCYVFRNGGVHTFNEDVACSIRLPKGLEDVELAVPAKEFKAALTKLKEDSIDVSVNRKEDSCELIVKSTEKKARRKFGIRVESKIVLPICDVENPEKWTKLPKDFAEAVDTVQGCAGRDEKQFVLVCVHIFSDGVEAMDNYQAIRFSLETGIDESVLVKAEQLKNVLKLGMEEWAVDDSWVHFRSDSGLVASCRRWNEKYLDLSTILKVDGVASPLPKGLVAAVEKAETFLDTDTDLSGMELGLKPGRLSLRAEGPKGWYQEDQKIEYDGDSLKFRIAPRLLREICSRSDSCVVGKERLMVKTEKFTYVSCLTIEGDGDE